MIDHISIAVKELERSVAFYDAFLGELGMTRIVDRPATAGYGKKYPEFWLNLRPDLSRAPVDVGSHVCLRARSIEIVTSCYEIALSLGGLDDGAPGPRQGEMTEYFGAFIKDPDGNKIEIVTFPPPNSEGF
ncbi:VOC family protein [Sneathiella marina]|uniref:VOC family protein n=1 Tax=Sneathiella marina TaxID=2950108 RepID=A0ABY4VY63_9PROT|nr:VOC family protein [Sneathiella marina]USG59863.1 VOC family protein [Sneathiella marina]